MPLHHAVLALLDDKPAHGYELKSSFEQAVGESQPWADGAREHNYMAVIYST